MGSMLAIPFFVWLIFTSFDFGNFDQIFALLAVIGLIINFVNRDKVRTMNILLLDILSFMLLVSPIVRRISVVPIEKFNYLLFTVPTTIFITFYLISIYFSYKLLKRNNRVKIKR